MDIIEFVKIISKLKALKRSGWVKNNIPDPESVAEHSFQLSLLTMVLASKFGLNVARAIKMALIHDLGEAEIGDIVTVRSGKKLSNHKAKLLKERLSVEKISSLLDSEEIISLFEEFEENKTAEAKLVRQLDKLEMSFQAYEYEKLYQKNLDEFFITTEAILENAELKKIFYELKSLRGLK